MKTKNCAIIVAAGKGTRMKAPQPKQFMALTSHPILWHTAKPFIQCKDIHEIIFAVPEIYIETCQREVIHSLCETLQVNDKNRSCLRCVKGGARRQDSVFAGLTELENTTDIVVIHDGVRPFVTPLQISRYVELAKEKKAVIPGIPPQETVKKVDEDGAINHTIDRSQIQMAQTPQAFSYELIKRAYDFGIQNSLTVTDDAMLVEKMGEKVYIDQGHPLNIKITTPEDLILAEKICQIWPPDNL